NYQGLAIHLMDFNIPRYVYMFYNDFVEKEEIFVQELLKDNDIYFFDIGANIGSYTLSASAVLGPQGKVIAFEPEKENYRLLCQAVDLNKRTNIITVNMGLSDELGDAELTLHNGANTGRRHFTLTNEKQAARNVQVITL